MDNNLVIGQEITFNMDGSTRKGFVERLSINGETIVIKTYQNDSLIIPVKNINPVKKTKK